MVAHRFAIAATVVATLVSGAAHAADGAARDRAALVRSHLVHDFRAAAARPATAVADPGAVAPVTIYGSLAQNLPGYRGTLVSL